MASNVNQYFGIDLPNPEVHGSNAVAWSVMKLLSNPGWKETVALAVHHKNKVDGGKVVSSVSLISEKRGDKTYIQVNNNRISSYKNRNTCSVKTAIDIIRFLSGKCNEQNVVCRVGETQFNSEAIFSAIFSLLYKDSFIEQLRVITPDGTSERFYTISISKIRGKQAFRWCGENNKPNGAGSFSIVGSGTDGSIHPVYVAASIAERLYLREPNTSLYCLSTFLDKEDL